MSTWYDTWFESPWYPKLYQHRSSEEATEAVMLVDNVAGIPKGSRILDLACGYGRHAYALAEDDYLVVGLDSSSSLIGRARDTYAHDNISYYVGDMRDPYPGAPYDAIVNFFTSFGYYEDNGDDKRVLSAVFEALKPGGAFILDFLNANVVKRDLEPETYTRLGGATVVQERRIEGRFVIKYITINDPCSIESVCQERVRLYGREELEDLITEAGLVVDSVIGSYSAEPFELETSSRCILIAHRPH